MYRIWTGQLLSASAPASFADRRRARVEGWRDELRALNNNHLIGKRSHPSYAITASLLMFS
jgi:hypothetical protein